MSRRFLHRRHLTIVTIGLSLISLGGCLDYFSTDGPQKVRIEPERFYHVETLELQKSAEQQVEPITDVNEVPAEEITLTLEQCRALTLGNNLDLKVRLVDPAVAAERVNQERAKYELAFTARGGYGKTDTPQPSTDYSYSALGVNMPLRTGGTVTFDISDDRAKTDSIWSTFNPSYSSDIALSLSQPLLRNAGRRASTYSIHIAEYDRYITDARTKLEVIRVLAEVDKVYWRLYAARMELAVRKTQYDLAKELYEQALRFVDAGDKPQVEVVRTEAGVAQQLEAIILAENSVRDRERDLKRALNKRGLGMQTPTVIVPATVPDPVRYDLERRHLVAVAIDNRTEMLELELQIAQDVLTTDFMKNQALPLVTMDYRYNINGLGPTRDDSLDLLFDKRFEDHSIGFQLFVPLGNEAAKSQMLQALYLRRQRLASRDSREAHIELEVLNAIDQVEANWQRVLASRQRAILDGRLFRAEQRQFELGLLISTDVLQAQANFADAQSREILALAEYQISLIDLAYATGTLLGAAKVQWEPLASPGDFQ
ncbi:MAG: TolC family protein [Planctomycetota bacterium]